MSVTRKQDIVAQRNPAFALQNAAIDGFAAGLGTAAAVGFSVFIPVLAIAGGIAGYILTNETPRS